MKKFLAAVVFCVVLYVGARLHLRWNEANSENGTRVSFAIPRGSSLGQISDLLEEKELIQDSWSFEMYARWYDFATKFQAGEYIIPRNLTFAEISEIIQNGKSSEMKVTIPEGYTIKQIDNVLTRKNLIQPGDFERCASFCDLDISVKNLEGSLWPSTYFVNPQQFSAEKFIRRLYNNFQVQLKPFRRDIQNSGRTENEIVIMASMIEREGFGDDYAEKQKIAGILWKRLDERIHLGVDATTRYEKNDWKNPLYTEDFAKDSPYNTRKNYGLPPTAISNPGLDSLKAAIYPTESEYYYYLHDNSGQIRYGRTLDEHNANKRKYLY